MAQLQRAQPFAHATLRHHPPGDFRGSLQIVDGAGVHFAADYFLRHATAEEAGDVVHQFALADEVFVLDRQTPGQPQRHPPGKNRHLVDGIAQRQDFLHQGVPDLVVGDDALFLLRDDAAVPFRPGDDAVSRRVEVGHLDLMLVLAGRLQRGLVNQIGQVGAGEARRAAGQHVQLDVIGQRLALGVNFQNAQPTAAIRAVHHHAPVKAARPQQGGVQHVGTVGGGEEDHAGIGVEPVHFHEELVEGLLALVVPAAQAGAALAAHGVDLIDKNQAGLVGLGRVEQVPDAGGADAHEHLHEIGSGNVEERHSGLAGDGARQQRLAAAGRAQ